MTGEPGLFEAFYGSAIQHPILLWLAALIGFGLCATRSGLAPSTLRYCAALTALALADAWLTSSHVYGVGSLSGRAASLVPLFFVLAGDYRFFLWVEGATSNGAFAPPPRAFLVAAGLTVVVPIFSQAVIWTLPESMSGARVLFFVYELAFFGLVLGLRARHPKLRALPWLDRVGRFVLLYYGLWASADAILLATGSDLGFALRVVPNLLYYGGLIAVIGRTAPRPSVPG